MGRGISARQEYNLIYRQLNRLVFQIRTRGGKASYRNREVTGTVYGHEVRIWYSKIGPASNGECMYWPVYTVDGHQVNHGPNDCCWRTLFDWISVVEEARRTT